MPKFDYVPVDEATKELMQEYRDAFQELYNKINDNIENSRGKSLALTKLEEASMWLNKGITNNS